MFLKLKLFIISLLPLYIILAVQNFNCDIFSNNKLLPLTKIIFEKNIPAFVLLCLIFVSLFFYLEFRYIIKGGHRNPFIITHIENINYEHLTFFITYLIPFIAYDLTNLRNIIIVSLLIIIICMIFIKTNLFYANPTLSIFGFHIYHINTLNENNLIIISVNKLKKDDQIFNKNISDNIYFGKL